MQNKPVLTLVIVLATISLIIWLVLTLARGAFWRLGPFDDDRARHLPPSTWPPVLAIVPARNEAETIGQSVAALLQQDYPGQFSVIVVDDHSEDDTSQIAQQTAKEKAAESQINIHAAAPLPPGWTGKLWALNEGISSSCAGTSSFADPRSYADSGSCTDTRSCAGPVSYPDPASSIVSSRPKRGMCFPPLDNPPTTDAKATNLSYFWLLDADVVHAPDTLRRLIARAEHDKLDLTSLMVLLRAKTLPERMLIPAFLFFFLKLYPPRWIANPKARTAGAAGGCVLVRRAALDRMGGLAAIRNEVIDDCALARAVKRSGGAIWMGVTRASRSLRAYNTFAEIRDMIARTAFTQLRYSTPLLIGTLAGLAFTYIAPVALVFTHPATARILALAAWLLMSLLFLPTVRFYRLSPFWAPLLPLAALFYAYATGLSALRYWLNRGAQWKGRSQAPRQV